MYVTSMKNQIRHELSLTSFDRMAWGRQTSLAFCKLQCHEMVLNREDARKSTLKSVNIFDVSILYTKAAHIEYGRFVEV